MVGQGGLGFPVRRHEHCEKRPYSHEGMTMTQRVTGIVTLSDGRYLDDVFRRNQLEWTVPCGRVGAPVAFVAQGPAAEGGQRIRALGRVVATCANMMWLQQPLRQADLTGADRKAPGRLGGFVTYRLQGIGAGVRSLAQWNRLLDVVRRLNPRANVEDFGRSYPIAVQSVSRRSWRPAAARESLGRARRSPDRFNRPLDCAPRRSKCQASS
jgi:hypothetical protein